MYAKMRNDGDGFGREEIVKGRRMGVKVGAKAFFSGDELRDEDVFAIKYEIRLTNGGRKVGDGREMEEVGEMRVQWKVEAGEIDGLDSFVVCGMLALGGLA